MSTNVLYHALGVWGYQDVNMHYAGSEVVVTVHQERCALRCAGCGSRQVVRRGSYPRRFRSVPIGSQPVQIELDVARLACAKCGANRQSDVGFADPGRNYTRTFERYALELSPHMTIQDVARHLHVGWDVIKEIQRRSLSQRFQKVKIGRASCRERV